MVRTFDRLRASGFAPFVVSLAGRPRRTMNGLPSNQRRNTPPSSVRRQCSATCCGEYSPPG